MELEPVGNSLENQFKNPEDLGTQKHLDFDQKRGVFESSRGRSKSSLRLRYEAEVEVIKRKLGSLEDIRNQLGLPQRKLCQLLLVDPSAWSRWIREGEDAPPHIYRMLQWYLALEEKYPALDPGFWLQSVAKTREPEETARLTREIQALNAKIEDLNAEIAKLRAAEESRKRPLKSKKLWAAFASALAAFAIGFLVMVLLSPQRSKASAYTPNRAPLVKNCGS